eukprot:5262423-Alexandrium_andersonii.AAC.1
MSASLVGSEMCIRDRTGTVGVVLRRPAVVSGPRGRVISDPVLATRAGAALSLRLGWTPATCRRRSSARTAGVQVLETRGSSAGPPP